MSNGLLWLWEPRANKYRARETSQRKRATEGDEQTGARPRAPSKTRLFLVPNGQNKGVFTIKAIKRHPATCVPHVLRRRYTWLEPFCEMGSNLQTRQKLTRPLRMAPQSERGARPREAYVKQMVFVLNQSVLVWKLVFF
jgi:hypothetical protein